MQEEIKKYLEDNYDMDVENAERVAELVYNYMTNSAIPDIVSDNYSPDI